MHDLERTFDRGLRRVEMRTGTDPVATTADRARLPIAFIVVQLVLAAVALIAVWLPARRASRVDPIVALRYE